MATRQLQDLGIQRVQDFFKSASRNMLVTIWTIRIIAIAMLFILVNQILQTLDSDVGDLNNLLSLFRFIILLFFVIMLALLTLVSFIATIAGGTVGSEYILAARAFVVEEIFGNIKLLPGLNEEAFFGANTDPLAPLAYLLNKPQKEVYNPILMKGILLLGVVLIVLTGIGFIRRSDVKLAGITLVISQLVIGLAYLKGYTVDLSLNNATIGTLLNSSLYRLAFISYLYFEFSLQTGYLYNLTTPTLTRQRRVGKQLERLSEFRLGITKLGTEAEKDSAEARKKYEQDQEQEERTSTAIAAGSSSTSAKKYSADALVFLLDSAQDSLFAKPGGEQERLTGRLQRYHDGLLQHDPKLDDKLGGSAEKAFNPFIVLFSVLGSLVVRVTILVFLSWLVVKPDTLLRFISLPESITNSLEIGEPEGLLMVLIPVVFLILGVSYLFAKAQAWVVKEEELIIDDSEINKLIKAGKAIEDRESGMQTLASLDNEQQGKTSEEPPTEAGKRRRRYRRRGKISDQ